ncbi:alkaline phosphatase, partial [Staphylococcus aureus]
GHTGEDVNTYAYGPRSESFSGNIENKNDHNTFTYARISSNTTILLCK